MPREKLETLRKELIDERDAFVERCCPIIRRAFAIELADWSAHHEGRVVRFMEGNGTYLLEVDGRDVEDIRDEYYEDDTESENYDENALSPEDVEPLCELLEWYEKLADELDQTHMLCDIEVKSEGGVITMTQNGGDSAA